MVGEEVWEAEMEKASSMGRVERPARPPVRKKAACSWDDGRVECGE